MRAIAERDYGWAPDDRAPGRVSPRLTEESICRSLAAAGFDVEQVTEVSHQNSAESQRAWLSIPIFTRDRLGGLPYEDRMRVLDQAYERLGPGQTERAQWAVFVARAGDPGRRGHLGTRRLEGGIPTSAGAESARAGDDRDVTSEEFTNAHPALTQFWHPVALSSEVGREPVACRLGGQGWALARFSGDIAAFADACPHRRARLSAGQITDGTLQCTYHGWRFTPERQVRGLSRRSDTAGDPERATLRRPAAVAEQDGLVWLAPEPRGSLPLRCIAGLSRFAGGGQRSDPHRQLPRRGASAVRPWGHDRRRRAGTHPAAEVGSRGLSSRLSAAYVHQPHRPRGT